MNKINKIIFMGKEKKSTFEALQFLIKKGIKIEYAIIPENSTYLKDICEKNKIKILRDIELYEKINRNEIKDIDLVISFLFWKKIKLPIINLGKYGCVNFHPAPLPEYRGVGGYNFAILDNLDYWGVSAHYVDETIDTGKIIEVDRFIIDNKKIDVKELESLTQNYLLELFKKIIVKFENFKVNGENQTQGRYINKLELEREKEVFFDSKQEEIDKKIRAFWFPPYTGAYIVIDGKKYTLINDEMLKKYY